MTGILTPLALLLLGLLGAGFFEGYETGVYCLNRHRLRIRVARRDRAAMLVQRLVGRPHQFIASILLGTNISVYLATAALTSYLVQQTATRERADLIATVILAPTFFVFTQVIPKNLFRVRADTLVVRYRWPAAAAYITFAVPAAILSAIGTFISSIVTRKPPSPETVSRSELLYHISEARERGYLSHFQDRAVANVLQLSEKKLRDVMIPIDRVVTAPDTATVGDVRKMLKRRCFSRVPVYSGERDRVTGFLHILDMPLRGGDDKPVKDLLRPPFFLAADTPLHAALGAMQSGRRHMVIVADAIGAARPVTLGIVTLKDIIEEIVGELDAW